MIDTRFAVCMVSYGYFGEVMRLSEGMRAVGPARYDLAGVVAFMGDKDYDLEILINK